MRRGLFAVRRRRSQPVARPILRRATNAAAAAPNSRTIGGAGTSTPLDVEELVLDEEAELVLDDEAELVELEVLTPLLVEVEAVKKALLLEPPKKAPLKKPPPKARAPAPAPAPAPATTTPPPLLATSTGGSGGMGGG
jgi:hypothetical protein